VIVQHLTELTVTGILNRGEPNRECIALKVKQRVNLGQFGLMLGRYTNQDNALPYFDNLFWFGDGFVEPGDWLFIYTGSGQASKTRSADGAYDIFCLFWGKPTTLFAETSITPVLFRVDAVNFLRSPDNVPQTPMPQIK